MEQRNVITEHQSAFAQRLADTLAYLKIDGEVTAIASGCVVTRYEYTANESQNVRDYQKLGDNLRDLLQVPAVRVVPVDTASQLVTFEIPHPEVKPIALHAVLASEEFRNHQGRLPFVMGKDFSGRNVIEDLTRLPNLLLGGACGTGKSMFLDSLVLSLLARFSPDDLRLVLVDTKQLDLVKYSGIPHLHEPVVTAPDNAVEVFEWAVREKLRRYALLSAMDVSNIVDYNRKLAERGECQAEATADGLVHEPLPRLVIVVDELSDLMKHDADRVVESIAHLAPYGRAVGLHMVLATQRTSRAVLPGLLLANIPARIGFKLFSRVDSLQLLDQCDADSLLGNGDMLFLPPASSELERLHGAYVSDAEVRLLVAALKARQ